MQVILLEKVANLGELGEVVKVKDGFARNFLIPHGKAKRATDENLQGVRGAPRRAREGAGRPRSRKAQERGAKLDGLTLQITQKAGVDGRLFGSVTNYDIVEALQKQGHEVERAQIRMPQGPLKQVGDYPIADRAAHRRRGHDHRLGARRAVEVVASRDTKGPARALFFVSAAGSLRTVHSHVTHRRIHRHPRARRRLQRFRSACGQCIAREFVLMSPREFAYDPAGRSANKMAVAQPVARLKPRIRSSLALKVPPHSVEAEQSLLGGAAARQPGLRPRRRPGRRGATSTATTTAASGATSRS